MLQNGQRHSKNSSDFADELSVFDYFVGLELKVLFWQLVSDCMFVSCHVCVSE